MNETEWQKGRIEALSLIVRAVVRAHKVEESGCLGPTLIHLANEYLLDTPLETQTPDFRSGFEQELRRVVSILDGPVVELSRLGEEQNT